LDFSQVELTVEVVPELGLIWLSSQVGQRNGVHSNDVQDLFGGQVSLIVDQIRSETLLGHNVSGDVEVLGSSKELNSGGLISLSDLSRFDGVGDLSLKSVISIVLPNSSVVWLV